MGKIIGVKWRSGRDIVGIVAVQNDHNDLWRTYIGTVIGNDKKTDKEYIKTWGAKLNKVEAIAFFPYLDADKFDEEK